jgi:uncharacterized protein YacL
MILLYFVRFLFLVTSTAFLLLGLNQTAKSEQDITVFIIALSLTVLAIAVEWLTPKKSLFTLTGVFFGLLIGMFIGWALNQVIIMMNDFYWQLPKDTLEMGLRLADLCICYLCISIVIRTKDDFRFLVPYVEFTRQTRGLRPLVLDTSVIIDGRIADIAQTKLFDAPLIVLSTNYSSLRTPRTKSNAIAVDGAWTCSTSSKTAPLSKLRSTTPHRPVCRIIQKLIRNWLLSAKTVMDGLLPMTLI